MPLLTVCLVLIAIGVLLWLVNAYIPMAAPIKMALNIVVLVVVVVWLMKVFGLWEYLSQVRI